MVLLDLIGLFVFLLFALPAIALIAMVPAALVAFIVVFVWQKIENWIIQKTEKSKGNCNG